MPTSLVIVESPAKCKKIETYLGPGYKVIASFGHLRTISGLKSIDINNNFFTNYSIIQEEIKLKQIEKIRLSLVLIHLFKKDPFVMKYRPKIVGITKGKNH